MDQERIGRFIAELRHEKGLTQLRLAEILGVSDKTVSKWECGKGLPDISALMPLCETLEVNVNELLSGQRLSDDKEYSRKAEENMMQLIQSEQQNRKRSSSLALPAAIGAAAVILLMVFSLGSGGTVTFAHAIDAVSLIALIAPVVIALRAAGLSRDAWRGIRMAAGKSGQDISRARMALTLSSRLMLCCGALESLLQIVVVLASDTDMMAKNISVALLTAVYGLIGYLILLPLRSRLENAEHHITSA